MPVGRERIPHGATWILGRSRGIAHDVKHPGLLCFAAARGNQVLFFMASAHSDLCGRREARISMPAAPRAKAAASPASIGDAAGRHDRDGANSIHHGRDLAPQ